MALDADSFADLAVKYLQEELAAAFPSVVKSREVTEVTAASGETRFEITENVGPAEIDPVKARPEMKAIGRALVAFLKQQGEVSGGRIS
jgi:hypothetical protein